MSYTQNELEMFEKYASDLWDLLDDIDTTDDICKGDIDCYIKRVHILCARRFAYAKPDVLNGEEYLKWFRNWSGVSGNYDYIIESPTHGTGTSNKDVGPKINYKKS